MSSTWIGLIGILGIWLCNGIALPFFNRLKELMPEQLMVVRGLVTGLIALALTGGAITKGIDQWTFVLAACFAPACLGLYKGIRAWGASRTIIVVTLTPAVNFIIAWGEGTKVPIQALFSLGVVLIGVILALRKGGGSGQSTAPDKVIAGLGWSLFGALFNACFYEAMTRTHTPVFQATFWQALAVLVLGGLASLRANWSWCHKPKSSFVGYLVGFALIGGFLYFLANLVAFANLPKVVASVLAQGEVPVVVLMAGIILKERLNALQWLGVAITLGGASYLTVWLVSK